VGRQQGAQARRRARHDHHDATEAHQHLARTNKERVERLIADGRMTDAGLRAIEVARANGQWTFLDDVEDLVVPTT